MGNENTKKETKIKKIKIKQLKFTIMKQLTFILLAVLGISFMTSCETVEAGHKGVEVSWGGETNLNQVYPEGMDGGLHWIFDDMIQYDVREKTMVQVFEFNDKTVVFGKHLDGEQDGLRTDKKYINILPVETKMRKISNIVKKIY